MRGKTQMEYRLTSAQSRATSQVLVTGSSGFIGSHLCEALVTKSDRASRVYGLDILPPHRSDGYSPITADIRSPEQLRRSTEAVRPRVVIHLAAKAQAVPSWEDLPDIHTTNIAGTINVLTTMDPQCLIFASSCAVYGNTSANGARPTWSGVHPVGSYGMTKALGELICREWARRTGNAAVTLRLGNVVGKRCRGLVPYLVMHAQKYPEGFVPARLRGRGFIVRDYVPVSYVIQVIQAAMEKPLPSGSCATFNVGTGRGTTNRVVASVVQAVLERRGYRLHIDFDTPIGNQEARRVVLNSVTTEREFDLPAPTPDDVVLAIEEAVVDHLQQHVAANEAQPPQGIQEHA